MARLCPLFSGSTGNSYYIGSRSAGVLIDAGRSARQLDGMLRLCNIDPLAIHGILLTHEHSDHISGLQVFARKYKIPVYGSTGTLIALGDKLAGVEAHVAEAGMEIAGMSVTSFHTSHDCAEPLGYRIVTDDGRTLGFATDLGILSELVKEHLLGADMVVLESNHDRDMLRHGGYPIYLKQRILSDHGHLANDTCAAFLPELAQSGTRRFLLAHLSRENNTPSLAREAALTALARAGLSEQIDFLLNTASPENADGKSVIF